MELAEIKKLSIWTEIEEGKIDLGHYDNCVELQKFLDVLSKEIEQRDTNAQNDRDLIHSLDQKVDSLEKELQLAKNQIQEQRIEVQKIKNNLDPLLSNLLLATASLGYDLAFLGSWRKDYNRSPEFPPLNHAEKNFLSKIHAQRLEAINQYLVEICNELKLIHQPPFNIQYPSEF